MDRGTFALTIQKSCSEGVRFRARRIRTKREQLEIFQVLEPVRQVQNLALTVLYVPHVLDIGSPKESFTAPTLICGLSVFLGALEFGQSQPS